MKLLTSAMAIAIALSWSTVGEAQNNNTTKARKAATTTHQPQRARDAFASDRPNCAAYHGYNGCVGWDPDPTVRAMLQLDRGADDAD